MKIMRDDKSLGSEVFEKIPNKYMAVVVASKRAKALNDGARPLIKMNQAKPTTIAMEEIAAGLVIPINENPEVAAVEKKEKELLPAPEDVPVTEAEPEKKPEPAVKDAAEDKDKDEDKGKDEEE